MTVVAPKATERPTRGAAAGTPNASTKSATASDAGANGSSHDPRERRRREAIVKKAKTLGPEFARLVDDIGKRIHDIAGHPSYNSIQASGTPFASCDVSICADLRTVIAAIDKNAKETER